MRGKCGFELPTLLYPGLRRETDRGTVTAGKLLRNKQEDRSTDQKHKYLFKAGRADSGAGSGDGFSLTRPDIS